MPITGTIKSDGYYLFSGIKQLNIVWIDVDSRVDAVNQTTSNFIGSIQEIFRHEFVIMLTNGSGILIFE
jgi:hypothetical protein